MWEAWEWGYNHVYAGSPSRFNLASLPGSRASTASDESWGHESLGTCRVQVRRSWALLLCRPYLLPILSFSLWAIKIEKCGRHGKSNKAIYVYFSLPTFLSPRPSIPASKLPILALNFNYKQLKLKAWEAWPKAIHVCVFISLSPFSFQMNKANVLLFTFFCCEFPIVYSERSEHHSHSTEGSGSGQCSGLGEWKSNIFSLVTEVCKELYVCWIPKGNLHGLAAWDSLDPVAVCVCVCVCVCVFARLCSTVQWFDHWATSNRAGLILILGVCMHRVRFAHARCIIRTELEQSSWRSPGPFIKRCWQKGNGNRSVWTWTLDYMCPCITLHYELWTLTSTQLFRVLNIRVALIESITWSNGDQITVTADPETLLDRFRDYRPQIRTAHDSAMLLTWVEEGSGDGGPGFTSGQSNK